MPFAHVQYRSLRSSALDYTQRRNRFLCITLTYTVVFLVIACVFLGLYISANNSLNSNNCSVCAYLAAPLPCGYQLCCRAYDFYSFSYSYCLGSYAAQIYFIIMLICFIYGGYELLLIICIFCRGSALQQGTDVIAIQPTNQQYMMGNQMDPYANYGYPNGNNNVNIGMQQIQTMQQNGNMNFKIQAKATEIQIN